MLLGARMLENVSSVNLYSYTSQVRLFEGDAPAIYFQILDQTQDRSDQGYNPPGRRYVPNALSTLAVVLDNIDDARRVTRNATQPFANDPSIWMVQLLSTDTIRGTVSLKLTLTEPLSPSGSRITRGYVSSAIRVEGGSSLDSSIGWTGGTL